LDLVEGKLAFAVVNGRLKMTHVDELHGDMREANPEPSCRWPTRKHRCKRQAKKNERLSAHAETAAISGRAA
jgi:hypothetical protein